jgi:hypothetical protein
LAILSKNVKIARFKSVMKIKIYTLKGGFEKMAEQEMSPQIELVNSIKEKRPELVSHCYAVGLWIWAEFQQKPSQEEITLLKELGFRWNPKRKVWQNACGVKTRASATDPRKKYAVVSFDMD